MSIFIYVCVTKLWEERGSHCRWAWGKREILEVWEEEYLGSIKFSTLTSFVFQVFVDEVDITALNY